MSKCICMWHCKFMSFVVIYDDFIYQKYVKLLLFILSILQIDTKDILFICGGAFIDLEKTISERLYITIVKYEFICLNSFHPWGLLEVSK